MKLAIPDLISNSYFPALAAGENISFACALAFVLLIFVLMAILYVCKIFVKV